MAQNIYTTQFATKAELNSEISQTTTSINLSVDSKLSNYSTTNEMNSAISVSASGVESRVSQIYETKDNATTQYSSINQDIDEVNIEVGKKYNTSDFTNANITAKINDGTSSVKINANKIQLSATDVLNILAGNTINLTSKNIQISSDGLNVNADGDMILYDSGRNVFKVVDKSNQQNLIYINGEFLGVSTSYGSNLLSLGTINSNEGYISLEGNNGYTEVRAIYVKTPQVIQTSLEKIKKNIQESNINALELIKRAKIYEYNLKTEQDEDKKHIGFVIGDKYETPKEVISQSGEGIDTYTMSSIMWKAIQEQQKTIEDLQKEIKLLKGEENGKN